MEIRLKPLENSKWAMTFINMSDDPVDFILDWKKHDIGDDVNGRYLEIKSNTFKILDLFNNKNLEDTSINLKAKIEVHNVLMVILDKL